MAIPRPPKPAPTIATSWTCVPSTRGTLAEPYLGAVMESNIQVVHQMFDGFRQNGVEGTLATLDENVLIEIPPDLSAEPDDYRGHAGVRRYFAGFGGMLEDIRYEALELIPAGECVIARMRLSGRGVSSGIDVDLQGFTLHHLANGKITRIRPFADFESALRAATG